VAALWLIAEVLFVVSVFYARAAFQLRHGNLDFRNTGQVARWPTFRRLVCGRTQHPRRWP
jgi:hypothetical protein